MVYRRLFSGFILAILLTIGLLVNFAGLAKANGQGETSFGRASLLSGLVLPPNARFEKPLLQNTPVLTITKIAPKEVTAGESFTYTIIVSNSTITDATNAIITDTPDTSKLTFALPLSASYNSGTVTWEPITITGLSLITRTLMVTVNADVPPGEILTNTVGVTSTEGAGASDTVTSTITTAADLSIGKSSHPTSTVVAGETLTYTLTITNAAGPSIARNVVVTDTLPASVTVLSSTATNTQTGTDLGWELGELTVGTTRTITMVVEVDGLKRGLLANTASVTSTTIDPYTNDNSHTISTAVDAEVDLVLSKIDIDDFLSGTNIIYKLTITNTGPSAATNVVLTDTLPSDVYFPTMPGNCSSLPSSGTIVCNWNIIGSGDSKTINLGVQASGPGIYLNQATVTSNYDETETKPLDNFDDEETTVLPANPSITKSGPTSVRVGDPLTYILTIENSVRPDNNEARNVVLTDTLPSSVIFASSNPSTCNNNSGVITCDLGNIDNGHDLSVTITVTPTIAGTIVNTAEISTDNPDFDITDNIATKTTIINPVTDLTISKTASLNSVTAGNSLNYTIIITNNGPSEATGIVVTDVLTDGLTFSPSSDCNHNSGVVTCTLPSLLNDASHTFNFEVDVDPGARVSIANTATVTGNDFDPVDNNSASVETIVNAETILSISKSASPAIAIPGQSLTYMVTITNSGPSNATGLVVTDTLPAGVSFVSSGSGCSDLGGGIVRCTLSNLPRNNSHVFTLNTSVASNVTQPLQNQVRVTGNENSTGASGTLLTSVNPQADLDITKTASTASPGATLPRDIITYVLTVYNNGPSDATGVVVTDTLPAGVTFQSVIPLGDCSGTGTIVCNLGDLAANGTPVQVTIEVTVNEDATGTISNQATVSGNEEDPSAGNNISPQVSTAIGEFNKVYLPIIMKPAPTNLYIVNQTGGQVAITVFGTGVSCNVAPGTHHCGDFPPGTYSVQAVAQCGTGTRDRTYDSGTQYTTITCN